MTFSAQLPIHRYHRRYRKNWLDRTCDRLNRRADRTAQNQRHGARRQESELLRTVRDAVAELVPVEGNRDIQVADTQHDHRNRQSLHVSGIPVGPVRVTLPDRSGRRFPADSLFNSTRLPPVGTARDHSNPQAAAVHMEALDWSRRGRKGIQLAGRGRLRTREDLMNLVDKKIIFPVAPLCLALGVATLVAQTYKPKHVNRALEL